MRGGRLDIGIIGMGHVGPVIGSALRAVGHTIVGVSASSEESRERADALLPGIPILSVEEIVSRCQMVVLTVPDDQLEGLVKGLAELGAWQSSQLVVHTSGAHGIDILRPASGMGAIPLAIHPAMTFTGTSVDVPRLVGTPFAVTAPAIALPIAQALVVEMGGEPFEIAEEDRGVYHAALNHGANFLATVVAQSKQILSTVGIDDPGTFLRPLCEAALDRALRAGDRGVSGPIPRGDVGTIREHLSVLETKAKEENLAGEGQWAHRLQDARSTYAAMTLHTVDLLEFEGRINSQVASEIRAAVREMGEK